MEQISRSEAKEIGRKYYYTGKPCKNGHIDYRQTVNGNCVTCAYKRTDDWRIKNKEKIREQRKEYVKKYISENREKIRLKNKARYWTNPEKNRRMSREYAKKNREKINANTRRKRRENINVRLAHRIGNRVRKAIAGEIKHANIRSLLGCSVEYLKKYLEKQFDSGMSWDNYGQWHIDHISPVSKFDLSRSEEQKEAFHYTNLQPLWAFDNISKGAR